MAEAAMIAALRASPLFKDFASADVGRVAERCVFRELEKGEALFREGDDAAAFYVIASGQVKVFKESIDGRELIIKIMREGDLVGEAAALAGVPYPATAQALDDAAAVEVPRREFVALVKNEPNLALNIVAALSVRLNQISAVLEKLTLKDVPARLASYLLEHARADAEGGEYVALDVTKTSLAAALGTIPETLSRALRRFADAGLVASEGQRLIILDKPSLRLIAGSQDD
ncbi:MAG: cyclic nucleotide-binding domain-containing protein [candidate division Zixibacteria bacterium]|nr:cyclic nucleotide-binding domain-containing protein [candidate division Zixibacteria bacterium]